MASTPQLLRPQNLFSSTPVLDDSQQEGVDQAAGHGPIMDLGGPGTGKSTTAIEYTVARIKAGMRTSQKSLITNTRGPATQLRSQLTPRLTYARINSRAEIPVRSFASYAFDFIYRMREGDAATPRLLAGAEQDRVLAELIDGYITDSELTLDWPDSLKQAVGLRGLRHELRELIRSE